MGIQSDKDIILYNSCKNLITSRFFKVIESGIYDALSVDYDELRGIPNQLPITTRETWVKIYNEYCALTENNKALLRYALILEIEYLQKRIFTAKWIINRISSGKTDKDILQEYFKELAAWEYPINQNKPVLDEIERIGLQMKSTQVYLNRKQKELKSISTEEENNSSFIEQKILLEKALNKDYIDPDRITIYEWILQIKLAKKQKAA